MAEKITNMVVCNKCLVVIATFKKTQDGKNQLVIHKQVAIVDIDKPNNKANVICPNCGNKVAIDLSLWAQY